MITSTIQIPMAERRLSSPLAAGMLQLDGLNDLALREITWGADHGGAVVGASLWSADDPSALASVWMYRLPDGKAKFEQDVDFYRSQRKKSVRLPDGCKFEDGTLAPIHAPAGWTHEAFAIKPGSLVHIYTGDRAILIVRYVRRKGTLLDFALFTHVAARATFDSAAWVTTPPATVPRDDLPPAATDAPLPADVATEVARAVERARSRLEISKTATPTAIVTAIRIEVDQMIEAPKRVPSKVVGDLSLELGCMWGQAVCDAIGWVWSAVTFCGNVEPTFAIVSPDRSYVIAPMVYFRQQLMQRGQDADNTIELLFNMLAAGNLPETGPRRYRLLG